MCVAPDSTGDPRGHWRCEHRDNPNGDPNAVADRPGSSAYFYPDHTRQWPPIAFNVRNSHAASPNRRKFAKFRLTLGSVLLGAAEEASTMRPDTR